MMQSDLTVRHGTVASAADTFRRDIGIRDEPLATARGSGGYPP